jgi:hypothetical protein
MEPVLPLREVFAALARPDGTVADGPNAGPGPLPGHEGLPDDLLIRAIGSYADTAPAEVAEHLSAFVAAPTGAAEGLHLLAAAPVGTWTGEVSLTGHQSADEHLAGDGPAEGHEPPPAHDSGDVHDAPGDHGQDPDHDLGGLLHLGALGNADSLDSLDHASIAHPGLVTPTHEPVPDAVHDADFGRRVPDAGDHSGQEIFAEALTHTESEDVAHVPVGDLGALDSLDVPEAGPEEHHAPDAQGELESEPHGDGHHDPGLDHFAG